MEREKLRPLAPYIGIPLLGIALLLVRWNSADAFTLLQRELLLVIGYAAAVKDIREKLVSNRTVLALLVCWLLTMLPQLAVNVERGVSRLADSAGGFLIGGVLFLLVYLISKNGLGGGDVKFMAVTGLYLGVNGILPAMLYGSVLAALFGLTLILLKKIGRKDAIPLIPFLYVGILIVIFFF